MHVLGYERLLELKESNPVFNSYFHKLFVQFFFYTVTAWLVQCILELLSSCDSVLISFLALQGHKSEKLEKTCINLTIWLFLLHIFSFKNFPIFYENVFLLTSGHMEDKELKLYTPTIFRGLHSFIGKHRLQLFRGLDPAKF